MCLGVDGDERPYGAITAPSHRALASRSTYGNQPQARRDF
jgi:hypothetical protein